MAAGEYTKVELSVPNAVVKDQHLHRSLRRRCGGTGSHRSFQGDYPKYRPRRSGIFLRCGTATSS
jgi:hypothetical protein